MGISVLYCTQYYLPGSVARIAFTLKLNAKSITFTTFSIGTPLSATMVKVISLFDLPAFFSSLILLLTAELNLPELANFRPSTYHSPFLVIETGIADGATVVALDEGNFKFKAFGLTNVEVRMKKMSNRKMMSVKEDILNSALTLFLLFNPIYSCFKS